MRRYVAKNLRLAGRFLPLVKTGRKSSTIRYGFVFFTSEFTALVSGREALPIRIRQLDYTKTYGSLSEADAELDGFDSLTELQSELRRFYPDITDDAPLTVVHFRLLPDADPDHIREISDSEEVPNR